MFERILLPVSGSPESIVAAEFAIKLATVHNSQILALNVVDTSVVRQLAQRSGKSPGEVDVEIEENGWHYLYYVEEMAKDNKVRTVVLLEHGFPQERIVSKAREYKAELIVIGQSAKRGTPGISFDRFSQYIMEQASCPVLIVK
jgi:nucleotide-binding universal stress UspA family protein